jgi:hypothetical protein
MTYSFYVGRFGSENSRKTAELWPFLFSCCMKLRLFPPRHTLAFILLHHRTMASLNLPALTKACTEARGLSMDAVHKANSGHLGLPLGVTELGTLFPFPLLFSSLLYSFSLFLRCCIVRTFPQIQSRQGMQRDLYPS